MTTSIKNIIKLIFSTIGSRVVGLVRDMLMLAYMGLSGANSAFLLSLGSFLVHFKRKPDFIGFVRQCNC